MSSKDLDLAHTLADAFNLLADEVQTLTDRRTVLEHKLRFAHEQFQYLGDKYAPASPEIGETLASLQLPTPSEVDDTATVPLPQRSTQRSQHQLAVIIRDGRRMASQLASRRETSKTTDSSRGPFSEVGEGQTSMSTDLEHDFTVEGKKGELQCPFSRTGASLEGAEDATHQDGDDHEQSEGAQEGDAPVVEITGCPAMFVGERGSQTGTNVTAGGKCPIRHMDKDSPAEIAAYLETHKHELPRSHKVCLRRYSKNEQEVRKIESKYGNLPSMIQGLSHLHQPMLPEDDEEAQQNGDRGSNERVENWAHAVSVTTDPETPEEPRGNEADRQGHFDRPLKEVRVGESPSRPWGISVPVNNTFNGHEQPFSPPPAPVRMTTPQAEAESPAKPRGKCPFDHTKMSAGMANMLGDNPPGPSSSFHGLPPSTPPNPAPPQMQDNAATSHYEQQPSQHGAPPVASSPYGAHPQPTFINPETMQGQGGSNPPPQMVFTGPVFIGYPMEQALQFLNQYKGNQ